MKPIFKVLDVETATNWTTIQDELKNTENHEGRIGELSKIMSGMLQEFSDSYDKFQQAPPGIKDTLNVMLALASCDDEEKLKKALNEHAFLDSLQNATTQVESIQSGLNYVKAGLRFIAALTLLLIIAPIVFFSSTVLGIFAGLPIPYVGLAMLPPLAAIPTFYTYKAGYDLLTTGIRQIQRTQLENGSEGKIVSQMGLFRAALENNYSTPGTSSVSETSTSIQETPHQSNILTDPYSEYRHNYR